LKLLIIWVIVKAFKRGDFVVIDALRK